MLMMINNINRKENVTCSHLGDFTRAHKNN